MNSATKSNTLTVVPARKTSRPSSTSKRSRTSGAGKARQATIPDGLRVTLTYAMAAVMPLLSVAGARLTGTLVRADAWFVASVAGVVALTIFAVSLSHVAQAVRALTKAPLAHSRALAMAFDGAIIAAELTMGALPNDVGLARVCIALMVGMGLLTALLNLCAFKLHAATQH